MTGIAATPSRFGSQNNSATGTSFALDFEQFLKIFVGEVYEAYAEQNILMPLTTIRTISSGKQAQFPVMGRASAAYVTPGTQVLGDSQIPGNEVLVNIDSLLVADTFIANIDEAMSQFEVRSHYAKILGRAMAYQNDKNTAIVAYLAARASANATGLPGGTSLINANAANDAVTLAGQLFAAQQQLDLNWVPPEDRHAVLAPAQYYMLTQATNLLNREWGGNGSISEGKIWKVAGLEIHKSNNLPNGQNITTNPTGAFNTYNGNFTNNVAAVFHREAVATVKLLDIALETEYMVSRQGTLFVAKQAIGTAPLRPEAAIEIRTA